MKKRLFVIFMLMALLVYGMQDLKAYSPHYLPGGKNYISVDNFLIDGDYYVTDEAFLIKPYTEYTITIPRLYADEQGCAIQLIFYDNQAWLDDIEIDIMDMDYYNDGSNEWFTYTFTSSSENNYLGLSFYNSSDYFTNTGFDGFQLEEGAVFTGYEAYIEGSLIDTSSPYFQSASTVLSYYDSPITVAEIQSALTAYDAIDGDVTSNITLVSDGYTANIDVLGSYELVFEVSDISGNTAQINITVDLVDVLNPVFSEMDSIQAVYPNVYSSNDILAMMSASDNYDGDISSQITLISDGYTANSEVVGSYDMVFSVTDSSGNTSTYTQQIDVVDIEGPVISGATSVIVGYDNEITVASVSDNLTCVDNYDDLGSLELVLESNDYTSNRQSIGTYEMVFSVTDSSGNKTFQTVTIEVVDELGPVVYFNSSIIQTYTDDVMTLPDFVQLLVSANEIDKSKDYYVSVNYDSYSKNADIPGIYHLSLNLRTDYGDDFDKNFQVKVVERPTDYVQPADEDNLATTNFLEKYQSYLIGGSMAVLLLASNLVWLLVLKKKS